MEIVAMSAVCLALGLVVGYEWGEKRGSRKRQAVVLPDYDMSNPINQSRSTRTVVECGREWTVYGGYNGRWKDNETPDSDDYCSFAERR